MAEITYQITPGRGRQPFRRGQMRRPGGGAGGPDLGQGISLKLEAFAQKQQEEGQPEEEPPICPIHQVPMT